MRILHVTPLSFDYISGLSLFCKNLSNNLTYMKKIRSDILTIDLFNKHEKVEKINSFTSIYYTKKYFFYKTKFIYPISNIISFLIKNHKNYDIIHVHGYHFFSTLQCVFLKIFLRFKLIVHIHGGIQNYRTSVSPIENLLLIFKEKFFDKIIGNLIFKAADKIISVAERDLSIIQENLKVDPKKTYYIPLGIDTNTFRRIPNIKRSYITLIATRLNYVKGVDIFLKIVDKLHEYDENLKFLIIGEGPLKNKVLKAQKLLPIVYYSSYDHDKIMDIYNNSKLVVITSRTEGIPTIIFESLACETPIISSNVGGIKKVIKHNKNGFLYDIENYNDAIRYILELINNNEKLELFGKNGRELVKKKYSWEKITEQIFDVYKTLF